MRCNLCPVACGADRSTKSGACGAKGIRIAKYGLHFYEEPPISFKRGSGCIFFCGCSLKCVFCQNYEVSRNMRGRDISVEELASIFKELESMGAENINLVNPTHYVDEIAKAFALYRPNIPVVYNTHGYETLHCLKIADSFTDIYLPDLKFTDPFLAQRYTSRKDYAEYAMPAVRFMAQKPLSLSPDGKLLSGCVVRHLVLPLAAYDSVNVVKFVASLPRTVYFSLMRQYTPCGEAEKFEELKRKITQREYSVALSAVGEYGLENVFVQDSDSADAEFIPEWDY